MLNVENRYANTMLKIEKQKILNSKTQEIVADKKCDFEKRQDELSNAESNLKSLLWDIEKQQKNFELVNRKIEIALEKAEVS